MDVRASIGWTSGQHTVDIRANIGLSSRAPGNLGQRPNLPLLPSFYHGRRRRGAKQLKQLNEYFKQLTVLSVNKVGQGCQGQGGQSSGGNLGRARTRAKGGHKEASWLWGCSCG